MIDYAAARLNMVEGQIRANQVTELSLHGAFSAVPRELFVPPHLRGIAYVDEDLRLAGDRYLMEPMVLARLLQLADIGPNDLVLDVGAATGYSSAVIAQLGCTVFSLESNPDLAAEAARLFGELSADNVVPINGPLRDGHPKQAPYNVIVLEGAVDEIPESLSDQLAEGGRLVAVVRDERGLGQGMLFGRAGGLFSGRAVFDAATPPLPGFAREPGFVF